LSRTDVLVEIKEAEASAKVAIGEAEAGKKVAVANARKEAVDRIQAAEAAARSRSEAKLAEEKSTLAVKRDEILEGGRKEADKLSKSSKTKIPKVKEFLNTEFERALDAAS